MVPVFLFTFLLLVTSVAALTGKAADNGFSRVLRAARAFIGASVVVGPGLLLFSSTHKSGLDCSDLSWGDTPIAERDLVYRDAAQMMTWASIGSIALACVLLVLLFRNRSGFKSQTGFLLHMALVEFMIMGYLLVIWLGTVFYNCVEGVNV